MLWGSSQACPGPTGRLPSPFALASGALQSPRPEGHTEVAAHTQSPGATWRKPWEDRAGRPQLGPCWAGGGGGRKPGCQSSEEARILSFGQMGPQQVLPALAPAAILPSRASSGGPQGSCCIAAFVSSGGRWSRHACNRKYDRNHSAFTGHFITREVPCFYASKLHRPVLRSPLF